MNGSEIVIRMAGEAQVTRDDAIFAALARGETVAITRFAVSTPTIALLAFISDPPFACEEFALPISHCRCRRTAKVQLNPPPFDHQGVGGVHTISPFPSTHTGACSLAHRRCGKGGVHSLTSGERLA